MIRYDMTCRLLHFGGGGLNLTSVPPALVGSYSESAFLTSDARLGRVTI